MARGAAGRLDQRGVGAQEALLVGIQHGDQRDLGQVETLAEQVDADERVELAEAQPPQDGDALEGINVGVEILDARVSLVR